MRVCVCCGLCGVFDFVTFDNHCPLLFKVFRGMGHRDKNSERRTFLSLWYRLRKGLIFLIKKVLLLVQRTKETFDQRGPLAVLVMDHWTSGISKLSCQFPLFLSLIPFKLVNGMPVAQSCGTLPAADPLQGRDTASASNLPTQPAPPVNSW